MMTPTYPKVDASDLLGDTHFYADQARVCVDDDTRPVYFDDVDYAASIPQGIENTGGEPVFGYSWNAMDNMLERAGMVIAHGHITQSWRTRFEGEYGAVGDGAIPHFIGVFSASTEGDVIVCDPMHKGGAVVMSRDDLQTFFKSPVNVYDTAIRLVTWMNQDADSARWVGTVRPGEWEHYGPIEVEAGTLVVTMTGTGDGDLYVRNGAEPTASDWDCRPNGGTSAEECRLEGAGRYIVGVHGYGTLRSDYNLSYRIEESAPTAEEALKPFEVDADEWQIFSPVDIDDDSTLVLTMTGPDDADLYARKGMEPTQGVWDCRPYATTSAEQCRLDGAGTWYFGVRGYASPSSKVTLSATVEKRTE
jgi:hypothetical protein